MRPLGPERIELDRVPPAAVYKASGQFQFFEFYTRRQGCGHEFLGRHVCAVVRYGWGDYDPVAALVEVVAEVEHAAGRNRLVQYVLDFTGKVSCRGTEVVLGCQCDKVEHHDTGRDCEYRDNNDEFDERERPVMHCRPLHICGDIACLRSVRSLAEYKLAVRKVLGFIFTAGLAVGA